MFDYYKEIPFHSVSTNESDFNTQEVEESVQGGDCFSFDYAKHIPLDSVK